MDTSLAAPPGSHGALLALNMDTWELNADRRLRIGAAVAVCAAVAATGFWRLAHQAVWHDEAFSVQMAQLDFPTLLQALRKGETPTALYYFVLHFWQPSGAGEAWLRLPSVLFGIASALTLFALNQRVFGLSTAITSCALLAVNMFFIRYMQEARTYMLAVLLVVAATLSFVVALDRPTANRWFIYGVLSALSIYAHVFSAFVVAAHLFTLPFRSTLPRLTHVVGAYLTAALLVIPLAFLIVTSEPLGRSFVPPPRLNSFEWLFLHLTGGGGVTSRNGHLLVLTYFVACCAGVWMMARDVLNRREHVTHRTASYALVLLWLGVPVLSSFAISFLRPIFYPRYLIAVLPALVTIAAIGISTLRRPALRVMAVGTVVVLSISPLRAYYGTSIREGGDWRRATEYVVRHTRPGDGILFLSMYGRRPFEYYLNRSAGHDEPVPLFPSQRWGAYPPVLVDNDIEPTSIAAERLNSHTRIWVMLHWGGFDNAAEDGAPLKRALEAGFRLIDTRPFGPSLEVRLYERERGHYP